MLKFLPWKNTHPRSLRNMTYSVIGLAMFMIVTQLFNTLLPIIGLLICLLLLLKFTVPAYPLFEVNRKVWALTGIGLLVGAGLRGFAETIAPAPEGAEVTFSWGLAGFAIISFGLVALIEEIIFRGHIFDVVDRNLPLSMLSSYMVTLIFTSALFASFHPTNTMPIIFLAGLIFGTFRFFTSSLIPSITCHFAFNMSALLLLV